MLAREAAWRGAILGQLARYGTTGAALNGGLFLVYLGLTEAGLDPLTASTTTFLAGIPLSLQAHRRWTFRSGAVPLPRKVLFGAVYLVGYATQTGSLAALHQLVELPHPFAQAVAMVLVAAVLFAFQKLVVFRA